MRLTEVVALQEIAVAGAAAVGTLDALLALDIIPPHTASAVRKVIANYEAAKQAHAAIVEASP